MCVCVSVLCDLLHARVIYISCHDDACNISIAEVERKKSEGKGKVGREGKVRLKIVVEGEQESEWKEEKENDGKKS